MGYYLVAPLDGDIDGDIMFIWNSVLISLHTADRLPRQCPYKSSNHINSPNPQSTIRPKKIYHITSRPHNLPSALPFLKYLLNNLPSLTRNPLHILHNQPTYTLSQHFHTYPPHATSSIISQKIPNLDLHEI